MLSLSLISKFSYSRINCKASEVESWLIIKCCKMSPLAKILKHRRQPFDNSMNSAIHTATRFIQSLKRHGTTFHLFIKGLKCFEVSQISAFQIVLMTRSRPLTASDFNCPRSSTECSLRQCVVNHCD